MLATQALRALSALLTDSSPAFDRRRYLESKAFGILQAYSRGSVQSGIDAAPVAGIVTAEARASLERRPELAEAGGRARHRLATAALLRMMTLHDNPRRWLVRPDDAALRFYSQDAALEAQLVDPDPPDRSEVPAEVVSHPGVLIAIDCPLDAVARFIAATGPSAKGIVLAPTPSAEARRAFLQGLPGQAAEIETGVDLGSGPVTAWVWPAA